MSGHEPGTGENVARDEWAPYPSQFGPSILPFTARRFPPIPQSAAHARWFTLQTLRRWGMGQVAESTLTVVSELVTTAVRHSRRDHAWLGLARLGDAVQCLCSFAWDEDSTTATVRPAVDERTRRLLEELCDTWGWTRDLRLYARVSAHRETALTVKPQPAPRATPRRPIVFSNRGGLPWTSPC